MLTRVLGVLDGQSSTGHRTTSPWQQDYLPGWWHGAMSGQNGRCQGEVQCPRKVLPSVWECPFSQYSKKLIILLPLQMSPPLLSSVENKNDHHLSNTSWVSGIVQLFFSNSCYKSVRWVLFSPFTKERGSERIALPTHTGSSRLEWSQVCSETKARPSHTGHNVPHA